MHPDMKLKTTGTVQKDVTRFLRIRSIRKERIDLKNLGIKGYTYDQILDKIESCFKD